MSRTPEEVAAYVEGYLHGARCLTGRIGIEFGDLEQPVVAAAWDNFLNKVLVVQIGSGGAMYAEDVDELREQVERYRDTPTTQEARS
jgi:hypothetical protein